jgi:membrane fusion protein (multidrug efflux system)
MLRNGLSFVLFSLFLLVSGCGTGSKTTAAAPPAPLVEVTEIHPQDVPIYSEYAAETYARDQVEVRGRVDGYIEKRLFQIGADVEAGQDLYVLDLRPYQADVAHAQGQVARSESALEFAKKQVSKLQADADLAQAEANLVKARQDVDRLIPLVKQDAAAQQDLDNAHAALDANQANVNAKKASVEQTRISTDTQISGAQAQLDTDRAALKTAQLNLEYATIQAPISGRIGDSLVQVGGLVSRTSPQPLTTIVPLDPIWVRFKVSESEYLNLQRRNSQDRTLEAPLELILADGASFPYKGRVENTVNAVDSKTGTLELQAKFPNPQHTVLPGQFGRIRLAASLRKDALLVPQRAVSDLQGLQSVFTVGDDKKAVTRNVVTGERVGEYWVVQQGLKPGDKVIVEGLQRVRPGMLVNPKPYRAGDGAGK